jgi:hypothetical protein
VYELLIFPPAGRKADLKGENGFLTDPSKMLQFEQLENPKCYTRFPSNPGWSVYAW